MRTVEPMGARMLVLRAEEQKETASGLIIPETHMEPPNEGDVITVGPEVKYVKPGDRIVLGRFTGMGVSLKLEGDTEMNDNYVILPEQDAVGIIRET